MPIYPATGTYLVPSITQLFFQVIYYLVIFFFRAVLCLFDGLVFSHLREDGRVREGLLYIQLNAQLARYFFYDKPQTQIKQRQYIT